MTRLAAILAVACLAGCSDSPPEMETRSSSSAPSPTYEALEIPTGVPEAKRYATLADLGADLGCEDIVSGGTGDNPGLRDFGHCVIPRFGLSLDVYLVRGTSWDYITSEIAGVNGDDWIVLTDSEEIARFVRGTIGGRVEVPTPDRTESP